MYRLHHDQSFFKFQQRSGDGRKDHHGVSNHDNQGNTPMIPSAPPIPISMGELPPAYEDIANQPSLYILEQQESAVDSTYLVVCA